MDRQLPEHDQDPSKCHELSPAEVKQMEQYVRKCKDEALGVGDVMLPEEMAQLQAGGQGSGRTPGASGFGPGAGVGGGAEAAGTNSGSVSAGSGVGGSGPAGQLAGSGSTPASGTVQSAGLRPPGGAMGTVATAGAINAGLPQKNFVRRFTSFLIINIVLCVYSSYTLNHPRKEICSSYSFSRCHRSFDRFVHLLIEI